MPNNNKKNVFCDARIYPSSKIGEGPPLLKVSFSVNVQKVFFNKSIFYNCFLSKANGHRIEKR